MNKYNSPEWIGQKFGMLTVQEAVHVENKMGKMWYWRVKCDCGNEKIARPSELLSGHNKSCGKHPVAWNKSHGESHTRLHNIWCGMNSRCNPNNIDSGRYGKRGIKICEEWKSYEAFAKWARENGYGPDLTIERIDVNGDYCPENCTWIPMEKQARNRRTTRVVEYNGKEMSLAEACELAGLSYKLVFCRMKQSGWPFEKAISTPVGAETGKTAYKRVCVCCGKEFTSQSPRSKFCSKKCFRVINNQCRREKLSFPQYYEKHLTNHES